MSVVLLKDALELSNFGGKAANLAKMLQAALPVPDGLAVSIEAFAGDSLKPDAKAEIEKMLDQNKYYAVRSSALAEDAANESWAGQFETFLNTSASDVISKIEECHNSTKARAKAYGGNEQFDIAVVVQEMLAPEYAGVLFTKDPVTGEDKAVVEYVEGLGEQLVGGVVDPKRLSLNDKAPFDIKQLADLSKKVVTTFGSPQDIEWAWANGKMWLVQTRPITATGARAEYHLGEPEELFYWGPSRTKPLYMSDFIEAVEQFFTSLNADKSLPDPPKTLVLFHDGQVVWLINAKAFSNFTEQLFAAYQAGNRLADDKKEWQSSTGQDSDLVSSWLHTLFAEFSLYGAETVIAKRLQRFDDRTKQQIWTAFTVPDNSTFLSRIDDELLETGNASVIAAKYPWIQDGYDGVAENPQAYFAERLEMLKKSPPRAIQSKQSREAMIQTLKLSSEEVAALNLTRNLAEFMDDRKAWMMQTRRTVMNRNIQFEHGWFFNNGVSKSLPAHTSSELWQRYIDFKTATTQVKGIVASNGGQEFISGEVKIASSPSDNVPDGCILVVPSTSPSYVPLMRTAKALVTDHGGMMSHAAIVAREFGLPCIVGTKQATKVLNNGDKVVLNLVNGEVNL